MISLFRFADQNNWPFDQAVTLARQNNLKIFRHCGQQVISTADAQRLETHLEGWRATLQELSRANADV